MNNIIQTTASSNVEDKLQTSKPQKGNAIQKIELFIIHDIVFGRHEKENIFRVNNQSKTLLGLLL